MSAFNVEVTGPLTPQLRLFTIYEDTEAGVTAAWIVDEIRRSIRNRCVLLQELWKLDLIAGFVQFREVTVEDAAAADVVLLSLKSLEQPVPSVCSWLESLKSQRAQRTTPGLLLAVLGTEEEEARVAESPLMNCLQQFSRSARLEFAWAPGDAYRLRDSAWLDQKLDSVVNYRLSPPSVTELFDTRKREEIDYDFEWVALP